MPAIGISAQSRMNTYMKTVSHSVFRNFSKPEKMSVTMQALPRTISRKNCIMPYVSGGTTSKVYRPVTGDCLTVIFVSPRPAALSPRYLDISTAFSVPKNRSRMLGTSCVTTRKISMAMTAIFHFPARAALPLVLRSEYDSSIR